MPIQGAVFGPSSPIPAMVTARPLRGCADPASQRGPSNHRHDHADHLRSFSPFLCRAAVWAVALLPALAAAVRLQTALAYLDALYAGDCRPAPQMAKDDASSMSSPAPPSAGLTACASQPSARPPSHRGEHRPRYANRRTTFRSTFSLRRLPAVWRMQCVDACSRWVAEASKSEPRCRSAAAAACMTPLGGHAVDEQIEARSRHGFRRGFRILGCRATGSNSSPNAEHCIPLGARAPQLRSLEPLRRSFLSGAG